MAADKWRWKALGSEEDSLTQSTLSTEQSFSVSARTPNSAFTFGDSNSNLTSPENIVDSVALNGDSDEEDEVASSSSRSRLVASLRSQLAQAIEDSNHAAKSTESLLDELERVKTQSAIELSELNEQVGEMRLEMHQLEMQLEDSLAQRTEESDQRIEIEREDQEETFREAIAETERLRAALAEEQESQITASNVRGKLEETGKSLAAARQEKRNLEERADKLEQQKNQVGEELSILRKAKKELEDRVNDLDSVRAREDERYRALLRDYDALADQKGSCSTKIRPARRIPEGEGTDRAKSALCQRGT